MSKPVILTGLRANNDLHIGNYFGAILPMVDMAHQKSDEFQVNVFVPDLHSFTTPIDHGQLYQQTLQNVKSIVAAGLDLSKPGTYIYRQSFIPAHSELTWILDCFTNFGEMNRMTQFKDKSNAQHIYDLIEHLHNDMRAKLEKFNSTDNSAENRADFLHKLSTDTFDFVDKILKNENQREHSSVGLFNYPVLMAADILLYGAAYVPVGDDQTQHLEFARDIAERMNNRFGELFVVPKPVKQQHEFFGNDQGLRIKDLADPTKKMSKSDDTGKGVIFLNDDTETVQNKIMSATTDSEGSIKLDWEKQPGISNLLQILALINKEPLNQTVKNWEGKTNYGELKNAVFEGLDKLLSEYQNSLGQIDDDEVLTKLTEGEKAMNQAANQTLLEVQKAVGLRPKHE